MTSVEFSNPFAPLDPEGQFTQNDPENRMGYKRNFLRRIAQSTELYEESQDLRPLEAHTVHQTPSSLESRKVQELANCSPMGLKIDVAKEQEIQSASSSPPKTNILDNLHAFWAILTDNAQKLTPATSCSQWMQNISQNVLFGAPDLQQLKEEITGDFADREQSKKIYLAWLEMCNTLEQSSEETVIQQLGSCATMVSPTGQPLVHLLLANFDFFALMAVKKFLPEALFALNEKQQDAWQYCQSLPLCYRTQEIKTEDGNVISPREWKSNLTSSGVLESPRLVAAAVLRSSSSKKKQSSHLKELVKLSVPDIFDQFHEWEKKEQKAYLEFAGMDHLVLNGETLLMYMIRRSHWNAAKLLIRYGCQVDEQIFEAYRRVKSENPVFKMDVLDCAWEKSKLVKCCKAGLKSKVKLQTFIDIYQGDFTADVRIDHKNAPLCQHLLNLKDRDITRCLNNRMKGLNQLAVVNTSEL